MSFFAVTRNRPDPAANRKEGGFLLMTTGLAILVIIAMVGSLNFVFTSESRFNANYAAGERLGWLANQAHIYAQQTVYTAGGTVQGANMLNTGMTVPDGFNFSPAGNTNFSVEAIGVDQAPVAGNVPLRFRAASAYIHLRVRTTNGQARFPNDTVSFLSGANHAKLGRVGFYLTNITPGDTCDGQPTVVRWGNESSSCLNALQAAMFNDVQPGDIIVPAWETALAMVDRNALLRYPQPERPSFNQVTTNLDMQNNNIVDVTDAAMRSLTQPANGSLTTTNLETRTGTQTVMNGAARVTMNPGQQLNIAGIGRSGNAMTVNGPVVFNGNVNVADTLSHGAGNGIRVTIDNPATPAASPTLSVPNMRSTMGQGNPAEALVLIRRPGAPAPLPGDRPMLSTRTLGGTLQRLTLTGATSRLVVADTLDTVSGTIKPLVTDIGLYASHLQVSGTGVIVPSDKAGWSVGSIEQQNSRPLVMESLYAKDCNGFGCATNVTVTPEVDD